MRIGRGVLLAIVMMVGCGGGDALPNLEVYGEGGVGNEDGWSDSAGNSWMPLKSCKQDSDCASGYCLTVLADSVCGYPCSKDKTCNRPGWACFPVREEDSLKEVCLPDISMLCLPCSMDEECGPLDGSFAGLCMALEGQGHFCGRECVKNEHCPAGYVCKAVQTGRAGLVGQCQPKGGQCVCNEIGKKNVLAADCSFENEWGECPGEISCPKSGPAKCTAAVPGEDVCDGVDNNCDGVTDDGGDVGDKCGLTGKGECSMGLVTCKDGEELCEGAIYPEDEKCDGLDNDCNGEADEDFPGKGNPCGLNLGVCIPGKLLCKNGATFCQDEMFGAPEVCDDLDNDCDGQTDEELPGAGETCGESEGECQQGKTACMDGKWGCAGEKGPSEEVCDGLDNDCDGSTDMPECEDEPGEDGGAGDGL